jgi:hypothetical protein
MLPYRVIQNLKIARLLDNIFADLDMVAKHVIVHDDQMGFPPSIRQSQAYKSNAKHYRQRDTDSDCARTENEALKS